MNAKPLTFADSGRVALFALCAFCALMRLAASAAALPPDPLKQILPRPQVVEPGTGTVSGSALARITVEKGPVLGAPPAVACEAYALEIRPEGVLITAPDARGERYAREIGRASCRERVLPTV